MYYLRNTCVSEGTKVEHRSLQIRQLVPPSSTAYHPPTHPRYPRTKSTTRLHSPPKKQKVIGKPPGRVTKCAATVEFRRDGTVATSFDGRETVSDFTFRAHAWPRACTIEVRTRNAAATMKNGNKSPGDGVAAARERWWKRLQ